MENPATECAFPVQNSKHFRLRRAIWDKSLFVKNLRPFGPTFIIEFEWSGSLRQNPELQNPELHVQESAVRIKPQLLYARGTSTEKQIDTPVRPTPLTSVRERKGPQSQVRSRVGDTAQRELDSLDPLMDQHIHSSVSFVVFSVFLTILTLVIEILVVLWYWGVALAGGGEASVSMHTQSSAQWHVWGCVCTWSET